jgi:hypothetical protein
MLGTISAVGELWRGQGNYGSWRAPVSSPWD